MDELYNNLYGSNVTIISNEFLENYLSDTRPEYIKVFLFYLWKGLKEEYTISEISNELDLEEEKVESALKFWIRKKLIKKECLIKEKKESSSKIEKTENLVDFQTKKKELINKNRKDYVEIERDLLFVAEKLLGQTMSERQQALIAKCYNEYGFEEALIQYLLEYCANNSKTNVKYMSAVAMSWYEEGIKTVDAAKTFTEKFEVKNSSTPKKRTNAKIIDRDEYNKMFMENILKSSL